VPALSPLVGFRVVASPAALDRAHWDNDHLDTGSEIRLRIAPDEAFWVGPGWLEVDDDDAIVVREEGFVGAMCLRRDIERHMEWTLTGSFGQGKVAGVPVKLWVDGQSVLLITHAAYAHELEGRLGWR
jgi:hypothetical protein